MRRGQKFVRWLIYIQLKIFHFFILLLPFKVSIWLISQLGILTYYFLKRSRLIVLDNLSRCFPEKDAKEIRRIARESFRNQAKNLIEVVSLSKINLSRLQTLVSAEGLDNLSNALKEGKGVLILSAHLGNWELLGVYLSMVGYPINVIARRIYDERLNNILVNLRESKGVKCILRSESVYQVLRCLRRNEALGVLIDQDTKVQGVFVEFFGRLAYTPQGLAALSLRTGAIVVPGFIVRVGNKHKVIIKKKVELKRSQDEKQDIKDNTQIFTKIIESMISSYPSQWVWMHERWKTKPEDKRV